MFISEEPSTVATFRSSNSERFALWICVAGIIGLGIVSYFYDSIIAAA